MRLQVWAWRCEVVTCGHTWLAVGIDPPAQCSKCKSRSWHTKISFTGKVAATDETRTFTTISVPAEGVITIRPEAHPPVAGSEMRIGKPDLEALVSGIMAKPNDHGFNLPEGATVTGAETTAVCGFLSEHDEQTGEHYTCGKAPHSGKIQHGNWRLAR